MKRVSIIAALILFYTLGSCRYGSFWDAQTACAIWAAKKQGVVEVDFNGDNRKASRSKTSNASGHLVQLRQCFHAKGMGHITGKELLTSSDKSLSKSEYSKIEARYKRFWFN